MQSRHERRGWPRAHWPESDREERSGPARLNTGDRIRRSHWRPAILPGSSLPPSSTTAQGGQHGGSRQNQTAGPRCGGAGRPQSSPRGGMPIEPPLPGLSVKLPSRRSPETRTLLHQSHLPSPVRSGPAHPSDDVRATNTRRTRTHRLHTGAPLLISSAAAAADLTADGCLSLRTSRRMGLLTPPRLAPFWATR